MKRLILSIFFVLGAVTTATLGQNRTTYTSTKASACRTILATDYRTGSYVGECSGVGGYKIRVIEGDIRQTMDVITPKKKRFELKFWEFYGSFSSIGEKVEWRTRSGRPVALIVRYNVADPEGIRPSTSYLMVAKVGPTQACVTDIVPPIARQNEIARGLADKAPSRPCKAKE